ncbi:hypothetical protein [Chryseolinea lacunae]|uniref:Lipocalin-like domain-containing protein n=1 Tax=Chryseolinea lacunae TaxID=2801331 RepID=A0ABS1KSI2_9BACT|nr:hypothetical protein [Chryseolinea lacunae]MBL0742411.1 hypothetical protein [Chryseolinea lacunae]
MKWNAILFILILCIASGCSKEVSDEKFVGTWELNGRSMFEGIQIKIEKKDGDFVGKIIHLNDNKFIKMFADSGDVWVSAITRSSNFDFKLTEKKIARDLFSLYGLSTSQDFKVQFIDDNTIGLGSDSADPQRSSVLYKRIP